MKHFLRYFLVALALCLLPVSAAQAATCYWFYGGTDHNYSTPGNWWTLDNHLVACAASGNYPHSSGDIANLDASSGSDTVIQDVDINLGATGTLNATGFTGAWDNSSGNHNVTANTVTFSSTGNPALTMGSGTWAQSGTSPTWTFTTTGSFSGASAAISLENLPTSGLGASTFSGGSHTFGAATLAAYAGGGVYSFATTTTFASFAATPSANIVIASGITVTSTAAVTLTGTASNPFSFGTSANNGTVATFTVGSGSTCAYCAFRSITSSNMSATCSFNLGGNTLNSISNSCGGASGGYIIGQ